MCMYTYYNVGSFWGKLCKTGVSDTVWALGTFLCCGESVNNVGFEKSGVDFAVRLVGKGGLDDGMSIEV